MSAALTAWRPGAIDAEFLGQARALRDRLKITSVECSRLIDEIAMPAVKRAKRHPIPRREQLVDVARRWSCMPKLGLLNASSDLDLRKRVLRISQLRACPSDFRAATWLVNEAGVSILGLQLDIAPHLLKFAMPSLVVVSLHALARRYQRGIEINDAAVFADLHVLARAHPRLAEGAVGDGFEILAEGGSWCGNMADVMNANDAIVDRVLSVRTYKGVRQ